MGSGTSQWSCESTFHSFSVSLIPALAQLDLPDSMVGLSDPMAGLSNLKAGFSDTMAGLSEKKTMAGLLTLWPALQALT